MSDIEQFEKRRDALMRWTPNKSDDDPIEAVDLMGYILTASELMNDLLAEVKRLREGIREICDTGADTAYDWLSMAIKRLEKLIE